MYKVYYGSSVVLCYTQNMILLFPALPTVVSFRCRNMMLYTDPKYQCVLEYDVYGRAKGCLDLSHLTNCGKYYVNSMIPVTVDLVHVL